MPGKRKPSGPEAFEEFYSKLYQDRWITLKKSLLEKRENIVRPNGYAMDQASIIAAYALDVQPGDSVLDLCAAPGGKTLILAEMLFSSAQSGELIANELSSTRRARLITVLKEYLPENIRGKIKVTGRDGSKWGVHQKDYFDRILLDAPCSSEEHVLQDPKYLRQWSPARTKQLAQRQYALLCSALLALKPGGRIVYSTCSISPLENEMVIEKLLHKKENALEVAISLSSDAALAEKLKHGAILLPNRTQMGPMYICALTKRPN